MLTFSLYRVWIVLPFDRSFNKRIYEAKSLPVRVDVFIESERQRSTASHTTSHIEYVTPTSRVLARLVDKSGRHLLFRPPCIRNGVSNARKWLRRYGNARFALPPQPMLPISQWFMTRRRSDVNGRKRTSAAAAACDLVRCSLRQGLLLSVTAALINISYRPVSWTNSRATTALIERFLSTPIYAYAAVTAIR